MKNKLLKSNNMICKECGREYKYTNRLFFCTYYCNRKYYNKNRKRTLLINGIDIKEYNKIKKRESRLRLKLKNI